MDSNECQTVIPVARSSQGKTTAQVLDEMESSIRQFSKNVKAEFKGDGEW
jgi:4-hydroxy-4-methyl-2-oxoglutarate aldolase